MNISDKLNSILTEYSSGNKELAYKKFKKIYLKNNKIHLVPANKNYKEKVLNINEVQIQGTLSGIIRKYN